MNRVSRPAATLWHKYLLIAGLYLAQGLPGGLIAYTLPVLMREQGAAQIWISAFSLIGIPWSVKLLWSRVLDQSPSKASYIGLSFILTALCWLALSIQPIATAFTEQKTTLMVLILLLVANFIMASQDILTDGLTVRLLNDEERGFANSLQVVAYKLGMLISGGLFLSHYSELGWQSGMQLIVLILAMGYLPVLYQLWWRRDAALHHSLRSTSQTQSPSEHKAQSLWRIIQGFVRTTGVPYWLLLLIAYKLPDGLISTVVRPFAVDYGMSKATIGQAANYAIIFGGIAGLFAGFLWRWQRKHYQKLLLLLACMQLLSNMGYAALTYLPPTPSLWWAVSLFEPVVDTMSTVILFAAMMHYARRAYAGVDYTFQATLFVIAASSMHLIGGWLTDAFGHRAVFGMAMLLSLVTIGLILKPLQHFGSDDANEQPVME